MSNLRDSRIWRFSDDTVFAIRQILKLSVECDRARGNDIAAQNAESLPRPGRWRFRHWLPSRCAHRVGYSFCVLNGMPYRLSGGLRGKLHRLGRCTDDASIRGCGARQN
jgi:hypothetical protein